MTAGSAVHVVPLEFEMPEVVLEPAVMLILCRTDLLSQHHLIDGCMIKIKKDHPVA
jgi:hypothetical protein